MYFELKQELFDRLREICMETRRAEESMSVTRMLTRLMDLEGLPMHCPYHHFIVPAALLTQSAVFEKRDVSELSAVAGSGGGTGENRTCRVLRRMRYVWLRGRCRHVSFHLYGRDAKIRGKLAAGQ